MDVNRIAIAIAHAEGFYSKGSLPQLANNPGDLELGDACKCGVIKGKTVFPDANTGWNHLFKQVAFMLSGTDPLWPPTMTLHDAGMKYSGNDPNWPKNVAAALGVAETITLAELSAYSENKAWPNAD